MPRRTDPPKDPFPSRLLRLIASPLSALLFALSHPNFITPGGLPLLAWVALVPLFLRLRNCESRGAALEGFGFGLLFTLASQYWLASFRLSALLLAALLAALRFSLLFWLLARALRRFPRLGPFLAAGLWAGAEYLATLGFLGYGFGSLAATQFGLAPLVRSAAVSGLFGLSFLIALANASFAELMPLPAEGNSPARPRGRDALYPFFVLALALGAELLATEPEAPRGQGTVGLRVSLIQPNVGGEQRGLPDYRASFERLKRLTDQALARDPDLIVWHETALVPSLNGHRSLRKDPETWDFLAEVEAYIAGLGRPLLFGNSLAEIKPGAGDEAWRIDRNAAILKLGQAESAYAKTRLVPFAESFPLGERIPLLGALVERIMGPAWAPGVGPEPLVLPARGERPALPFGSPICFEDGFGSYCAEFARRGARFLVVLTNDAWAKSAAAQAQHAALSAFRAAETGLPLLRAASTGYTGLLLPDGRVGPSLPPFAEAELDLSLELGEPRPTPYLVAGDLPLALLSLLALLATLAAALLPRGGGRAAGLDH